MIDRTYVADVKRYIQEPLMEMKWNMWSTAIGIIPPRSLFFFGEISYSFGFNYKMATKGFSKIVILFSIDPAVFYQKYLLFYYKNNNNRISFKS